MPDENPYGAPAPGYYGPPTVSPMRPVSGLAIGAMVTGIIADLMVLATCCVGPTFLAAGPLGIVAVVLANYGLKECREQDKEGRGFAIAGLACGWTAIGFFALGMIVVLAYVGLFVYMGINAPRR